LKKIPKEIRTSADMTKDRKSQWDAWNKYLYVDIKRASNSKRRDTRLDSTKNEHYTKSTSNVRERHTMCLVYFPGKSPKIPKEIIESRFG
jgi:fibronectin type 3 domain-containing protein